MLSAEQMREVKATTKAAIKAEFVEIMTKKGLTPEEIKIAMVEKESNGFFDEVTENAVKKAVNNQVKSGVDRAFEKFREEKFQEAKPQQLRTAGTRIWLVWVLGLLGPLGSGVTAIIMRSWLIGALTLSSLVLIGTTVDSLEQEERETIPIVLSFGVAGIASSQIRKNRRILGDSDGSRSRNKLKG